MLSDVLKKIIIVVAILFVIIAGILILVATFSSNKKKTKDEFATEEMVIYSTGTDAVKSTEEATTETPKISGGDSIFTTSDSADQKGSKTGSETASQSDAGLSSERNDYTYRDYDSETYTDEEAPKFFINRSSINITR